MTSSDKSPASSNSVIFLTISSLAYGGSKSTKSNCPLTTPIALLASIFNKWNCCSDFVILIFSKTIACAWRLRSTSTASSIPREIASIARLPLPENKSKTRPPSKNGPIILKIAPLTLSVVGRVIFPSSVFKGRPPNFPATTLITTIIAKFK